MSKRILGIAILALSAFAFAQDAAPTPGTPTAPKKPVVKKPSTAETTGTKDRKSVV